MSDITGVTGVSDSSALESTVTTAYGSDELDKETFLTLLTTQMQNQDPLDPLSNEEFVAQLAQFSSLEQQMVTNSMLESVYLGIASLNNSSMASLIGANVVALGDAFQYSGEGGAELHYDAAADVTAATVEVYDAEGNLVYSEEIGALDEGEGSWTWDGTDSSGQAVAEGEYTFKFTGEDAEGESVEITELIVGTVDEMDYSSGTPQPSIDGIKVELADIVRVTSGEDASADTDSSTESSTDSSEDSSESERERSE